MYSHSSHSAPKHGPQGKPLSTGNRIEKLIDANHQSPCRPLKQYAKREAHKASTPLNGARCWPLRCCNLLVAAVILPCSFGLSVPNKGHS